MIQCSIMSAEIPRVDEAPKPVILDPFPISRKAAETVFANIARDRKSYFLALGDKFLLENPVLLTFLLSEPMVPSEENERRTHILSISFGYALIDTEASIRGGTVPKIPEETIETYGLDLASDAEGAHLSDPDKKDQKEIENFLRSENVLVSVLAKNLLMPTEYVDDVLMELVHLFSLFKTHAELVKTNRLLGN